MEGTQVMISVPVERWPAPANISSISSVSSAVDMSPFNRLRVLLVDDHEIVRSGIAGLLAAAPDVDIVGEAADGLEAVEQAQKLRPDVIMMDINMPRMNGIEATRRIKSEMPRIRVIAFSMHDQADMDQGMREVGADGHIAKGAPCPEILKAIRGSDG
jgi:DNA-binding NarL/FixJ family response regulator